MEKKLINLKAILIDLSGTIYIGDSIIFGAIEAIKKLQESSIKFAFATNTSKESRKNIVNKLSKLGLVLNENKIITSLIAACNYVKKNKLKPYLFLEESAKKDFSDVCSINLENADSAIVGFSPSQLNYNEMNSLFNFFLKPENKLIAINKSKYFKNHDGLCIGTGAFIEALEFATNKKAIVVGKPQKEFFYQAIKSLDEDLNFEDVAMIGDDIKDDVLGAQSHGMIGILVRTGKYQKHDEFKYDEKPNFVFESLLDAVNFILLKKK